MLNYLSTEEDKNVAVQAIKQARDIVKYMDPIYCVEEVRPGIENTSFDDLVRSAGGLYFDLSLDATLLLLKFCYYPARYWDYYIPSCWDNENGTCK